ncbi:MAG: 2-C-methyl-D-erythritol 4-phosphate cytidylyltransferase, partial [Promicromonosporaceae bacterium]|nr:2-C-methyl-D-erythritol 4-phosphate cytidylyltransferase [Promicromonosporaceae bacterium]
MVTCILTAAGSGQRLGAPTPKALVEIDGVPLVLHAARRLAASGVVAAIVVTAPPGHNAQIHFALKNDNLPLPVLVVDGGDTRQASVAAGLAVISATETSVLVHDAARPFASPELIRRVVATVAAGYSAVVPGLPVADTIKQVTPDGLVIATPDRAALRSIQTPQGFDRAKLVRAHFEGAGADATDDAGLMEALGEPVVVVPGEEAAMKITTPTD